MDTITKAQRSRVMALVRSKDTRPELAVRRLLTSAGYRYRLHRVDLPGCPDIVLSGRRKIVFVHGCFWHQHAGCPQCRTPKSRVHFWRQKLGANRRRDARNRRDLRRLGWRVGVVWECELRRPERVLNRLREFLN